jgi:chromosome segregation ATPase
MAIGQIAELEDEVKAKDLIIVELKQKLKKEMNTREELVNSLNIEKLKIVELGHQMNDDQKKFNNLINEKEAEIAAVRDMLQEAERDKFIIKNELEKGKGVISSLMQEQDTLCKANVSISNELNSSEVTSKYWQDQHNQSSIQIKVLTEALNDKLATDSLTENDIIHHHHQSTTLADELEPYMTNHHHQQQLASSLACTK